MKAFLAVFFLVAVVFGQGRPTDQGAMPSKQEILELVGKADEKVSGFEEAIKNAKPYLDKINPEFSKSYLEAASEAHALIRAIQKSGESAYILVSLLATLDDLSLDAAKAGINLLRTDEAHVAKGAGADVGALTAVVLLGNASTACNDISELIMHATLRYVDVEERALGKLLEGQK